MALLYILITVKESHGKTKTSVCQLQAQWFLLKMEIFNASQILYSHSLLLLNKQEESEHLSGTIFSRGRMHMWCFSQFLVYC